MTIEELEKQDRQLGVEIFAIKVTINSDYRHSMSTENFERMTELVMAKKEQRNAIKNEIQSRS